MKNWMLFLSLIWASCLHAQEFVDDIIDDGSDVTYGVGQEYARITFAERYVRVLRADEYEDVVRNYPIISGDVLESNHGAYSEIQFIDGTLMQIDGDTQVEFQAINEVYSNESLSVINLFGGSLFFHLAEPLFDLNSRVYRIDSPSGSVYLEASGIYRIDYEGSNLRLKVYRGIAEISGTEDSTLVRSGEYAAISQGRYPGRVRPFNSFHSDKFERWAYARSLNHNGVSSRYVSPEIAQYANDLDGSGEWRYEPDIDIHVWVPHVAVDWSPYYNGYWTPCGTRLTWVSYDPFGWVTHHYGSWGWHTSWGWYWIPGRLFSPAWVAWTAYDDYVGWCPLGYWGTPYYYDRHFRPIYGVYHHHHNHWHYLDHRHIRHRHPAQVFRRDVPTARRKIVTRPIYVTRDDLAQPRAVTRVIREPEINRSRAATVRQRPSELRSGITREGRAATTVRIDNRSSGTKAVSRIVTTERRPAVEASRGRVPYEGRSTPSQARRTENARSETPRYTAPSRQTAPSRSSATPTRQSSSSSAARAPSTGTETRSTAPPKRSDVTRQAPSRTPQTSPSTQPSSRGTPSRSTAPRSTPATPTQRSKPSSAKPSTPSRPEATPKSVPQKTQPSKTRKQTAAAAPRRSPVSSTTAPRRSTVSSTTAPRRSTVSSTTAPRRSTVSSATAPRRSTVSSTTAPRRSTVSSTTAPRRSASSSTSSSHRSQTSYGSPSQNRASAAPKRTSSSSRPSRAAPPPRSSRPSQATPKRAPAPSSPRASKPSSSSSSATRQSSSSTSRKPSRAARRH